MTLDTVNASFRILQHILYAIKYVFWLFRLIDWLSLFLGWLYSYFLIIFRWQPNNRLFFVFYNIAILYLQTALLPMLLQLVPLRLMFIWTNTPLIKIKRIFILISLYMSRSAITTNLPWWTITLLTLTLFTTYCLLYLLLIHSNLILELNVIIVCNLFYCTAVVKYF